MTLVCVLLGAVKKLLQSYDVRHQEGCGTVARAACERYGMKLTFASDVGKDIIQVADAESQSKRSIENLIGSFHDGIKYFVDMNLTKYETKVYILMTQVKQFTWTTSQRRQIEI
jgi:hypothetical protein